MERPVVMGATNILIHVPELVRYGSKPRRDLGMEALEARNGLTLHLRTFADAVAYPPNQAFIGNVRPEDLVGIAEPWNYRDMAELPPTGPFGSIVSGGAFYGLLAEADQFQLLSLEPERRDELAELVSREPLLNGMAFPRLTDRTSNGPGSEGSLPLYVGDGRWGWIRAAEPFDEALAPHILLENLACKASAALALRCLMSLPGCGGAQDVPYIISCSEEAVGDRYNRGGGGLAKAIGEMAGCANASGSDVKAFCAAPIHALVVAAGLVASGAFPTVVVVGGGSLAKLGMKYGAHVGRGLPILEDCLGAFALLIGRDDGLSPRLRLDAVGRHTVGCGSSQEAILRALVVEPLERVGLRIVDVDKYATELHDPAITVNADRADVPRANYRMIAALAAMQGEIEPGQVEEFATSRGMAGFVPTQGHIPSAVPFMPHALGRMRFGEIRRAMFLGKGSPFLGRMTQQSDGMSILLEEQSAS